MEAVGSCIRGYNQKRIGISLGPIEYRESLRRQRRISLGRVSLTKMSYGMLDQARIEAAEKEAEQATDIAGRLAPWLPLWADGDEETRSAALSALADSRSRGDAVTKVFVEAACDPLPAARCQAMWWFGDEEGRGVGTAAFDALTAGLRDVDARVRAAAAQGLRFSDPAAIEPLLVALRDTDADVRSNVVIALKDFDLPVPSIFEALISVFHHDLDLEVRENALHALAYLDGTQALDVLRSAARAEDLRLRLAAALALGDSRSLPEAHRLELVSLMLADTDEEVRERAVRSLAPLFDEQPGAASLPLWHAALRDPAENVRVAALEALPLAGQGVAKRLSSLVSELLEDPVDEIRHAAIKALEFDAGAPIPPALLRLLQSSGKTGLHARKLAVQALADRGLADDAVPLLLPLLSENELARDVTDALIDLPDRRALAPLMAQLDNEDDDCCANAALALAAIGDGEAIEPLIRTLDRREPYVRRRIVWALSFFTSTRVMPVLTGSLSDPAPNVARTAARALLETLTPAQVRALLGRLPLLRRLPAPARELLRREREYELEEGDASSGPKCQRLVRLGATEYE